MAELQQVYTPLSQGRELNIIFVHGLGGHIKETWMSNPNDHTTLWPNWVGEDTNCPVWLLGYDAALSAWSEVAMALPQQGTNFLDTIESEPKLKGRPLILIGHSLGGLVIKMALANAQTLGVRRYEQLAEQIKGIVFIATPHFGSELATLASAVSVLRPNEQVGNLKVNDGYLLNLNAQFRSLHLKLGMAVRVFTETRGVTVKRRLFGFSVLPRKIVVAANSGDPHVQGEVATPMPEDHFSVCKPKNKSAQIHRSLISFIKEVQSVVFPPPASTNTLSSDVSALTGETQRDENEGSIVGDIAQSETWEPISVSLAISAYGIDLSGDAMATCALIVTDDPRALEEQMASLRDEISRNALIPIGIRGIAKSATLKELVINHATRQAMLERLAVTPFSAYVYYGNSSDIAQIDSSKRYERLFMEPLIHRLSKKSERVVNVYSDCIEIEPFLVRAVVEIKKRFNRTVEHPGSSGKRSRALVEISQLVAWATAQHLTRQNDYEASAIFESLRTRIRFAQDVITGTRHLRDDNPLP